MRFSPIPQRSDRGISYSTYENLVRQMRRMLNLRFDPNVFYVQQDPAGTFISVIPSSGAGDDPTKWRFGVSLTSRQESDDTIIQTVTLQDGTFQVQGDANYEIVGDEIDLPAAPVADDLCYVTVSFVIATKVASIKLLTAYPIMTADEVLVVLIRLKATTATTPVWAYDTPAYIHHRGDIQFSTALIFG